jgi:chorismate mutase
MSDLTQLRIDIDGIDDRIVDLLAQRFAICRQVADYKLRHDIPVVLPERIEQVKTRCADRAERQGVDRAFVLALYALIIDQTCETEWALQREVAAAAAARPGL